MTSFTSSNTINKNDVFCSKTWIGGSLNRMNQDKIYYYELDNGTKVLYIADGHGGFVTEHNYYIDIGGIIAHTTYIFLKKELMKNAEIFNGSDYIAYLDGLFDELHDFIQQYISKFLVARGFQTRITTETDSGIKFLNKGFVEYHFNNERTPVWKSLQGGTTVTMVIVVPNNKIISIQLGDSPAYVVMDNLDETRFRKVSDLSNTITTTSSENVKCLCLTPDNHTPTNKDDYLFITSECVKNLLPRMRFSQPINSQKSQLLYDSNDELITMTEGSHVKNVDFERHSFLSTILCNKINPPQKLSMTRSVGDFSLGALGLIHKPSVFELDLKDCDYQKILIVLMTDGISDCHTKQNLMNIFKDFHETNEDINSSLLSFMEEHQKIANKIFGENADNSTIGFFQLTNNSVSD